MATIIDEFVTLFTINPKGVTDGAKVVRDETRKTKDEAQRAGRDVQDTTKRSAEMVSSIRREVLSLGLAVAGASGIKAFFGTLVSNDAAIGRTATNLGIAARALATWQGAVESVGGSAGDADNTFRGLRGAEFSLRTTGKSGIGAELQAMGIAENDLMAGPEAMLKKLAAASERMDRQRFVGMAQQMGIPDSMITLLARGSGPLDDTIKKYWELNKNIEKNIEAAQKFQAVMSELQARLHDLARGPLTEFLGKLDGFITQAGGVEKASDLIVAGVAAIGGAAVLANLPLIAMVTSLTALIRLAQLWENRTPAQRKAKWDESKDFVAAMKRNDFEGAWAIFKSGMHDTLRDVGLESGGTAPGETAAGGATGPAPTGKASAMMAYLQKKGLSREQAAGAVANFQAESGLNGGAVGDGGAAYGIGQWHPDRQRRFRKKYGKSIGGASIREQLDFFLSELSDEESPAGRDFYAQTTAEGAASSLSRNYERPADREDEAAKRARIARGLLQSGGGARLAAPAAAARVANDNRQTHSTTVGDIIINTDGKSPEQVAVAVRREVSRRTMASNAPNGPQ